jgi:hypothetical protein
VTPGNQGAGGATRTAAEAAASRRAARLVRNAGQLRDGTPVRGRPLVPQDRALLLAGFRSADNAASLRMLDRLGELRSDCAGGDCDVVVQLSRSPAIVCAHAA